jgi:hypothetical protein
MAHVNRAHVLKVADRLKQRSTGSGSPADLRAPCDERDLVDRIVPMNLSDEPILKALGGSHRRASCSRIMR